MYEGEEVCTKKVKRREEKRGGEETIGIKNKFFAFYSLPGTIPGIPSYLVNGQH